MVAVVGKGIRLSTWLLCVVYVAYLLGCSASTTGDLDNAVRGERPKELWGTLNHDFKYLECLRHKVSLMRQGVGQAGGPIDLVSYYPSWVQELQDCARLYKVNPDGTEKLQEALASQMANVLGQETCSYLTMQRLYAPTATSARPRSGEPDWIDKWRAFAVIGIASTADILEESQ